MHSLPTDLDILNNIYRNYYDDFILFDEDGGDTRGRESKIYVPINVGRIAKELKTDETIVYTRLFLHLNRRYEFVDSRKGRVFFFVGQLGVHEGEILRDLVNFPYLASVLADLRHQDEDNRRNRSLVRLSVIAAVVSAIAAVIAIAVQMLGSNGTPPP